MRDTFLDSIKAYKLVEIEADKKARPLRDVEAVARKAAPIRPFMERLRAASLKGYGLIAEIKKSSPSSGIIRTDFDPSKIAAAYAEGGATCLSVLTDKPSFQGDKAFLSQARAACALPILRKDFIFDPYQIAEARSIGADCILLIMAALSDMQASELEASAIEWGMDVLVEVHDLAEVERAMRLHSKMIGINNRDLKTFKTQIGITHELSRHIPADYLIVSESGLSQPAQLKDLAAHGTRCFLIGESLMRHANVTAAVHNLINE